MGNAASSGIDPATVGMEADLERLGVRAPGIVADAMTEEDHVLKAPARRQKSSDSIKHKKSSDPAQVAIDEDMAILQLGFAVEGAGKRYRRQKSTDRNEPPVSTESVGKSNKARANKKRGNGTRSIQKHMKEIEDFVTVVSNDKNVKKQLRASIVVR